MFGVKIQMFDAVTRRLLFKQCECLRHDENYKVFNSQSQIGEVVSFWIACLTSEKWRLFQHGIVEWMDSWKSFHIFDPTSITLPNLTYLTITYGTNTIFLLNHLCTFFLKLTVEVPTYKLLQKLKSATTSNKKCLVMPFFSHKKPVPFATMTICHEMLFSVV